MQPKLDEISMRDFKPSKAAITAALGAHKQAVHSDGTKHMQPAARQQFGNRSPVSGWKPPGNQGFPGK